MINKRLRLIWIVLGIFILSGLAQAAPLSASYELNWYTIDGGGVSNSLTGVYSLSSAIGQPEAGQMSNSAYTLNGGFWGGTTTNYHVYLPLVLKG